MGRLASHQSVIFHLLVLHLNLLVFSFLSHVECHSQEYFKKKIGSKLRLIKSQQEKVRLEEQRNQMRVKVQEKLVVGLESLFTWNQDIITYHISTQPHLPSRLRNH